MEGPTSSWGSRNRITCLTFQEHDDDDDDEKNLLIMTPTWQTKTRPLSFKTTQKLCNHTHHNKSLEEYHLYKNFINILAPSTSNTIHFKVQRFVILNYLLVFRVTYTRCRTDTINSTDDGHIAVRNMWRIEINIHGKELCDKLVIYKGYLQRKWNCSALVSSCHCHNFNLFIHFPF